LLRHMPMGELPGWDDMVVGYDFELLAPAAILSWAARLAPRGPALQALVGLEGAEMLEFEAMLWEACAECTGKAPRPGSRRWERSQDRWRVALLKDALAAPLTSEALALAVEAIYERLGCPEDMLGLWRTIQGIKASDRIEVASFLERQERRLASVA